MNKLVILVSTFALVGCANVGVTQIKTEVARPPNCALDLYSSPEEIKKPYEVACLIDSRTGTTAFHSKTAAAAIEQAKPQACGCGADGLLIEKVNTEGITMMTWGKGTAIVKGIKYKK